MTDLGKKESCVECVPSTDKKENPEIRYPSIWISDRENLPFSEDDAGKEFTATVKIKVIRVSKSADEKKTSTSVDLDLISIGDISEVEEKDPSGEMDGIKKSADKKKNAFGISEDK